MSCGFELKVNNIFQLWSFLLRLSKKKWRNSCVRDDLQYLKEFFLQQTKFIFVLSSYWKRYLTSDHFS